MSETKRQIIEATIRCIEHNGIQAVTSREIAKEADVNVAAINYHFGEKKKLLSLAMKMTVDNGMEHIVGIFSDQTLLLRKKIFHFLIMVIENGKIFPNIMRAHLYDSIIHDEPPSIYMIKIAEQIRKAIELTEEKELPSDLKHLFREIELAVQAAFMLCLAPNLLQTTQKNDPVELANILLRMIRFSNDPKKNYDL